MLRLPIGELRPGMRLGKTILAANGRVLLNSGTELKESYIATLHKLGITAAFITNELAPDVEPHDVVADSSRQQVTAGLRETTEEINRAFAASMRAGNRRFSGGFNPGKLRSAVDIVVTDLLANTRAMVSLQDIRAVDEQMLGHSVSTCILSTLLGMAMGYNTSQLHELGMGALLHDIGKVGVPADLLSKSEPLTPAELGLVQQHATIGWDILSKQPQISFVSSAVALQHHERWAGGGYPRAMQGKEIHEYARICAVGDFYDTLVADRANHKGFSAHRALRFMQDLPGYFDPDILKVFSECVAVFPVGAVVEITGGFKAVVVSVERGKAERPHIRIIRDPSGEPVLTPTEIDLSKRSDIEIRRTSHEGARDFNPEGWS